MISRIDLNPPPKPERTLYCSFCGKSQHEVTRLIAGPGDVFICNECVELCSDIVREEAKASDDKALEIESIQRTIATLTQAVLHIFENAQDASEVRALIAQHVRPFATQKLPAPTPIDGIAA